MEFVIGYIACGATAFWLAQRDWRRKFDLTNRDMVFFLFVAAMGPVGLAAALLKLGSSWLARVSGPERVIWERRP